MLYRPYDTQHNVALVRGQLAINPNAHPSTVARALEWPLRPGTIQPTSNFWPVWRAAKGTQWVDKDDAHPSQDDYPPPKSRDQLSAEVLATLEDTPAGFERFVNRYWPHEKLTPHLKSFISAAWDEDQGKWKLRVIVTVPPDHAKTATFSTKMSIWRICQDRNFRRGVLSETQTFANQIAEEIAAELDPSQEPCHICGAEDHPSLPMEHGRFNSSEPGVIWRPGNGQLRVEGSKIKRGYNISARGLDQQVQGFRFDEFVMDDPQGPTAVETEDRRTRFSHKVRTVVLSRLDPACRAYVVCTRQHLFDFVSELTKQKSPNGTPFWEHIDFPAVLDWGKKKVLWDCVQDGGEHQTSGPLAYPKCCRSFEYLMTEVYPGIGADGFALTYLQQPQPPGSALVLREWIFGRDEERKGCLDFDRPYGPDKRELGWVRAVAYDPSGGVRKAALLVADVLESRSEFKVKVLEVIHKRIGVRDVLIELERIAEIYHPNFFIPEYNVFRATKDIVDFDTWCRRHGIKPIRHETTSNKNHTTAGIESLAVDFEAGNIRIPYTPDEKTQETAHALIDEALEYVRGSGGRSDDVLMALDVDTPLWTASGWKTMGAVEPGDMLAAPSGDLTLVTRVTEVQREPVWKVTLYDGSSLRASGAHRWWVTEARSGYLPHPPRWMTTEEMIASPYYLRLDSVEPLDLPERDLPLDPYVLGAWLGDGDACQGTLYQAQQDIPEMRAIIENAGYQTNGHAAPKSFGILGIRGVLNDLGVLGNKHVPEEYLRGSFKQRLSLLQGFMDTDGTITPEEQNRQRRCYFANTNKRLVDAVEFLALSLGFRPYVHFTPSRNPRHRDNWRVWFNVHAEDVNPFRLSRKAMRANGGPIKRSRSLTIKRIEADGEAEVRCVSVAHPSHQFLAGRRLVPTGNSLWFLKWNLNKLYLRPEVQGPTRDMDKWGSWNPKRERMAERW
jgi:hypothetical protein